MDSEKNGEKFNLTTFLNARTTCIAIVDEIVKSLPVGINEANAQILIKTIFEKHNITKFWHPTKIRIGSDTTKSFRELPDNTIYTQKNSLCFVDVGPVIDEHEADFGRTFLVQNESSNQLIAASSHVFNVAKTEWLKNSLSGINLYHFANNFAQTLGYQLSPLTLGHRLGDFPHRIHSSQKLSDYNLFPHKNLSVKWVLNP